MYDDDGEEISDSRAAIAKSIKQTAQLQHLTGVRHDTFTDTTSLCSTCKWSQSRRRASHNARRMECSIFSGPCPEDISECSEYATINSLTLNQMADIAIIIDITPPKRVGFQGDK
mgnify:CR=1 FL=1